MIVKYEVTMRVYPDQVKGKNGYKRLDREAQFAAVELSEERACNIHDQICEFLQNQLEEYLGDE